MEIWGNFASLQHHRLTEGVCNLSCPDKLTSSNEAVMRGKKSLFSLGICVRKENLEVGRQIDFVSLHISLKMWILESQKPCVCACGRVEIRWHWSEPTYNCWGTAAQRSPEWTWPAESDRCCRGSWSSAPPGTPCVGTCAPDPAPVARDNGTRSCSTPATLSPPALRRGWAAEGGEGCPKTRWKKWCRWGEGSGWGWSRKTQKQKEIRDGWRPQPRFQLRAVAATRRMFQLQNRSGKLSLVSKQHIFRWNSIHLEEDDRWACGDSYSPPPVHANSILEGDTNGLKMCNDIWVRC